MCHYTISPIRAKSQKCLLLLFPMLHLTAPPSTNFGFLCSNSPKTGVSKGKSAQKPRFCARNARKRGSRRPKKHKNPDFVLEMPENEGIEGQKRTKMLILCSKSPKTGVSEAKKAQKPRFCAREERKLTSGSITAETLIVNVGFLQITAHTFKT